MSSRLSCWLHGHSWGPWGTRRWSDLFGNTWVLRGCQQCGASDRKCVRAWHQ